MASDRPSGAAVNLLAELRRYDRPEYEKLPLLQRALEAAAAEAIESVEDFLLTERILIQRLLGQLQHRESRILGAPTGNSWAVAEIPDWELRQRLDAVERAIRALAAPQQEK